MPTWKELSYYEQQFVEHINRKRSVAPESTHDGLIGIFTLNKKNKKNVQKLYKKRDCLKKCIQENY